MKTVLLIILIQLLFIAKTFACGCSRGLITQKEYDKYALIFIGKLIEEEVYEYQKFQHLKFEVIEVLKRKTTKIVKGRNEGGSCSLTFEKGQEWIVYSNPENGSLTDQYACGHSILLKTESGESVIGNEDYFSEQEWQNELTFLKQRKSNEDKIVSYQLITLVPLLQNVLIIEAV